MNASAGFRRPKKMPTFFARKGAGTFALPLLLAVFCLSNALAGWCYILFLPERVAIHFDPSFTADRLGSPFLFFPLLLIPPVIAGILTAENVRKKQKRRNIRALNVTLTYTALLFVHIGWTMLVWCGGTQTPGEKSPAPLPLLICLPVGVLYALMGNYLPTIARNGTFGIKTPATLKSDYVWKGTHRTMGVLFLAAGLSEIVAAILDQYSGTAFSPAWIGFCTAFVFVLLPFVTAYYKKRDPANDR